MIDLELLRQEIRSMNTKKKIFRVLKEELSKLGYWKNRPRGDPRKGFMTSSQDKENEWVKYKRNSMR